MSFDVDIQIKKGSFALDARFQAPSGITVLFGRSGSGKTTLINAVAGLVQPEKGHIQVGDHVVFDSATGRSLPVRKRRLGYIFQDARLFPHMSVQGNLRYGAVSRRSNGSQVSFDQIVEMLGLGDLLGRRPTQLSGGEKQRVGIGRALLSNPEVILADEPLTALDARRKLEILPYFERIRDDLGLPILYVSHSASEVARLATTVVVLEQGRVVQVGSASEVLSDPSVAPTGVRNLGSVLRARLLHHHDDGLSELDANGIRLFVPKVQAAPGAEMRLRIAAHEIILSNRIPVGLSALNVLPGTISAIRAGEGPGALVTITTKAGPIIARITQRSAEDLGLKVGGEAYAVIKSVAIAPEDVSGQIAQYR